MKRNRSKTRVLSAVLARPRVRMAGDIMLIAALGYAAYLL